MILIAIITPFPFIAHRPHGTNPGLKIASDPPLDIMAIDNLPSLLPKESSIDFAEQIFPYLMQLVDKNYGVWQRAKQVFKSKLLEV